MSPDIGAEIVVIERPAAKAAERFPDIVGFIDSIHRTRVSGWTWDRLNPDERLDVEIRLDNEPIATVRADCLRADLANAGNMGDGTYGFQLELAADLTSDSLHRVSAFAHHGGKCGPVRLKNLAASGAADLNIRPSDFIGLIEQFDQSLADQRDGFRRIYHELQSLVTWLRDGQGTISADGMRPGLVSMRSELARLADNQATMEQRVAGLARRFDEIEVFHSRVDEMLALLRNAHDGSPPAGDQRGLKRLVAVLGCLTLASLATGIASLL